MIKEVIGYFPLEIQKKIKEIAEQKENIEEIRLRINRQITLKIGQNIEFINYIITKQDIEETFENICEKSIYSYTKQISEGFITIKGGNRVGITGSCAIEYGKVKNINYISSLNFRIARQIKDVSTKLLKYIIDIENDTIYNTMIVSPPGARKNDNFKRFSKNNFKPECQK